MTKLAKFLAVVTILIHYNGLQAKVSESVNPSEVQNVNQTFPQVQDQLPGCPKGQWWHTRGQRCVKVDCTGGNGIRDENTGECSTQTLSRDIRSSKFNNASGKSVKLSTSRSKGSKGPRRSGQEQRIFSVMKNQGSQAYSCLQWRNILGGYFVSKYLMFSG